MKNLFLGTLLTFATLSLFGGAMAKAQEQKPSSSTSNTNPDMQGMAGMNADENMQAMHAMDGHPMDMGPHMKMTSLRELQPGDQEKANAVVQAARKVASKYMDYKVALADGYEIFFPNVPQKQYHFNNREYAVEARESFNPEHPTSLLYEKQGDGYKLIGMMYTAPKKASEDELNSRVPLSIAQWHAHVNLCMPPADKRDETINSHSQFGFLGSISTKDACDAAGGRFMPQAFGWMVHVYPFEQKPEDIWSVERQAHHHMD